MLNIPFSTPYRACAGCGVVIDDGMIRDDKYYCHDCIDDTERAIHNGTDGD